MNLRDGARSARLFRDLEGPLVLVADELTPSMVAQLDWQCFAGLRHRRRQLDLSHRDPRAVDAHAGGRRAARRQRGHCPRRAARGRRRDRRRVRRSGSPTVLEHAARGRQEQRADCEQSLDEYRRLPAVTEDGVQIRARGQRRVSGRRAARAREAARKASGCSDRSSCSRARGARGARRGARSIDAYTRLVESMAPGRVTIRTFDVGEAQLPRRRAGAGRRARRRSACVASA